jgi:hypothetical protein
MTWRAGFMVLVLGAYFTEMTSRARMAVNAGRTTA